MTIKIRFTQNSFTEVEMSQSLSATYKCPHTHRQHMAVAPFKIYHGDFLNKLYISLQLRLFFSSIFAGGSCAAVNGCVCYIRIRRQKKLSLRYFVLFFKFGQQACALLNPPSRQRLVSVSASCFTNSYCYSLTQTRQEDRRGRREVM